MTPIIAIRQKIAMRKAYNIHYQLLMLFNYQAVDETGAKKDGSIDAVNVAQGRFAGCRKHGDKQDGGRPERRRAGQIGGM